MKRDRVELHPGVAQLPEEFREVARLANQAGLEGFEVAEVEYGFDLEAARDGVFRSCVTIRYHDKAVEGAA